MWKGLSRGEVFVPVREMLGRWDVGGVFLGLLVGGEMELE